MTLNKYYPRAYDMVRAAKQLAIQETGGCKLWPVCDRLEAIVKRRANGNLTWSQYLNRSGIETTSDVEKILEVV